MVNMHAILPCTRLIWVLRNPLSRAFSEYMHQAVKSNKYASFQSLLRDEIKALNACSRKKLYFESGFNNPFFQCLEKFRLQKYVLSTGFYAYFIHAWLDKFPFNQHLFLDYDSFRNTPDSTLQQIADFLNIAPNPIFEPIWRYNKANTNDGKAAQIRRVSIQLPEKILRDVETLVRPHVHELYRIIKQDFHWDLKSL